jgi:hypothetical protein
MSRQRSTIGALSSACMSLAVALGTLSSNADAGGFSANNLVVVRVGDGGVALSSSAAPVFLEERTQAGALIGTLPLPTAVAGANRRLTVTGTASSEAYLSRSSNGQYLTLMGYDANVGQPTVSATTSAVANRVIGRITVADETIDTTTALSDLTFNTGNPRSATSDDGTHFWCSGTGNSAANSGVRFVASLGASSSTQVSNTLTNTRVVNVFNDGTQNQLFVSSASGAFQGVSTVGSGTPTSGFPVPITLLNGFPTTTGPSSYDYFLANPTTLYVADDRALPNGGIQKWTLSAGTWTLAYTMNSGLTNGCRGLTGLAAGVDNPILFATTASLSANNIVTVTDSGAASPFSIIATAPTNTVFRGLRLLTPAAAPCPADTNNSGAVDVDDLVAVILGWGPCATCPAAGCASDIDNDCDTDVDDLVAVILAWGDCP